MAANLFEHVLAALDVVSIESVDVVGSHEPSMGANMLLRGGSQETEVFVNGSTANTLLQNHDVIVSVTVLCVSIHQRRLGESGSRERGE